MNSSNVIELNPVSEPAKPQLIMGLIPCQNQYILNLVGPIIAPGLKELADKSMDEFTVFQVMIDILFGGKQLHLGYLDRTGALKPEQFQEQFSVKLQEPSKDYVGFMIIEPLRNSGFHVFGVYVMPEYRETNLLSLGLAYLEQEARKMGSPFLSLATRHDASGALARLGFSETTSNYRKKLSKE